MNKMHKNASKKLKIVLDVSKTVSSTLDLDTVNDLILKKAIWALGTDHASLFLPDDSGKHLMLRAAKGFTKYEMSNLAILESWERINLQVARSKKPIIVNNLKSHAIFKKEKLPFSKKELPLNSFLSVPLMAKKNQIVGVLIVSNKKGHPNIFTKSDKELLMTLGNHVSIALLNAKLYKGLEDLFISTIKSLANAVDAKDPYTRGHSERVMRYSLAIAGKMELSEDFMKWLKLSSLLHDVGKIGIKDAILGKEAKLSMDEVKIMQQHPIIGINIVSSIIGSERIVRGISDHHEWVNGKGYPKKLTGDKISLEGKIIAIADTFDAMTTNRPYQKKFTSKEACLEIARNINTQFSPEVTRAFMRSFSEENHIWCMPSDLNR
ncbi:MAG: GAF domain-containing protein [Candidatus Omnitrophica bacterium]|nr:GAF domain-containing protein [Candidatus Omnitrophota bacterium]